LLSGAASETRPALKFVEGRVDVEKFRFFLIIIFFVDSPAIWWRRQRRGSHH
jgi:hypothetical protein